jgi:hypothetical protein
MSAPTLNDDPLLHCDVNPVAAAGFQPGFQLWFASPQTPDHFDPAILTEPDRRRFDSMRHPRRREEFSLSRALLARAAVPATASLSLSHSGGHAALASGPAGCAVGVDIERHRARDVASIAQFAFSESESAALLALAPPERERLFYLLWVMKEAFAKALQLPLLEALRSCIFNQRGSSWFGSVPTRHCWSVLAFEPRPKISLAIACVANQAEGLARTGLEASIETREWPLAPPDGWCWPRMAAITSAEERRR